MPHTPGPWIADLEDLPDGDDVPICAPDPSGVYVATVTTCWPCAEDEGGEQNEEGRANARLVAAAPDLLAVCERLLEAAEITPTDEFIGEDTAEVFNDSSWFTIGMAKQLQAAVARAKGA